MAKVLVCYKWVLDEADIRVGSDLSVDLSKAKYKISDYDKNTIEAGCRAAAAMEAGTVGLSCGGAETRKSFGDALARGLDEGVWVNTEGAGLVGVQTGRLLAAAVRKIPEAELVLCSEGSSDDYARQTGPRLGALLDWPVISSVVSFEIADGKVTATRKLEDCMQTVTAALPAVLCVLPEAAPAPIPGLKQVMAAKKKPVAEYSAADCGVDTAAPVDVKAMRGYISERKNVIITGDTKEQAVAALVAALRKEGVV